jgi:LuxR family maltose regulon positive regulatory protein
LKVLYATASQAGWGAGVVEVRLLQALAAATPLEALHFLDEALQKAQPERFIRTFVDKGEPMKALLERLKAQRGELKEYIMTILSAFGEKGRVNIQQALVEPLSERELDVLRLVAQGMSNGEIAGRLVVSVGTVKTHVHSIIEKLGVSSRTQAVAKARELGFF